MARAKSASTSVRLPANRHATGQTGEYLVAAELARRGFAVALPTGNAADFDVLAYKDGARLALQVKSSRGNSIQLNLGKFLKISMDGSQQTIDGHKDGVDLNLHFVSVFLSNQIGNDRFYCADMGVFLDFIALSHGSYLVRNGGERPGANKASLHWAGTESEFEAYGRFVSIDEMLRSASK